MTLAELDTLVRAVCPIDGINSSGVVFHQPSATASQKTAAQAVMTANLSSVTYPPGIG